LDAELVNELKGLGRTEGATLLMILLAAWQVLLARYSGQYDVIVGSPIANRRHAAIEGLIGFFVNTLALRAVLDEELSFRHLVAPLRETGLGGYAHQDMPFERVVDEIAPDRNLSRTPLFQVMLVLQNAPEAGLRVPGLELEVVELESGTSKFDMT